MAEEDGESMKNVTVRLARPEDAESFTKWATENQAIPTEDLQEFGKHATAVTFVVEVAGKPVFYFPVWAICKLGFLGFNPQADARERLAALDVGMEALQNFAREFHISEVQFTSTADESYPMLRWCEKRGFVPVDKRHFRLEVN